MIEPNLWVCGLLIALGMALNLFQRLYDLEQAGTILSPITFVREHPYQIICSVLGAYLLAIFWYYLGQLNEVNAILTGVACGTAAESLRSKAVARMNRAAPNENETGV